MTTIPHTASSPTSSEIGARVLALLTGLHDPEDLAPAAIERVTGVAVKRDSDNAERYGFGLPLEPGWMCHLSAVPNRLKATPKQLVISYDPDGADDSKFPAAAPVFDEFAETLVQAGYRRAPLYGPRNALWGQVFSRGDVEVRVNIEREDPLADAARLRVTRISVDTAVGTNTFVGGERHG